MLTVLPHPRELVLCDLFTKEGALQAFADLLRTEHRFRGRISLAHSSTGVPDEVYAEVRQHFTEEELVYLTLAVISINGWNRLAISFRTVPE